MSELENKAETNVETPAPVLEPTSPNGSETTSELVRIARSAPERRLALCAAQQVLQQHGAPQHAEVLGAVFDHVDELENRGWRSERTIDQAPIDEGAEYAELAKTIVDAAGGARSFRESAAIALFPEMIAAVEVHAPRAGEEDYSEAVRRTWNLVDALIAAKGGAS
jgi:hypothetical protein